MNWIGFERNRSQHYPGIRTEKTSENRTRLCQHLRKACCMGASVSCWRITPNTSSDMNVTMLLLYPEDGGRFLRNVGWLLTDYTALYLIITTAVRTSNSTQLNSVHNFPSYLRSILILCPICIYVFLLVSFPQVFPPKHCTNIKLNFINTPQAL
jgi:hypothetical protein